MACAAWRRIATTALVVLAFSSTARLAAQPSRDADKAIALALFDEARALMKAGRHEEACLKLAESMRLAAGIGTQFQLAQCLERTGRLASAWVHYAAVVEATERSGQTARAAVARTRVAALAPRLARLRIEVEQPAPAVVVTRNGTEVPSAQWGSGLPVDPDRYVVEASAPGMLAWRTEIDVRVEGDTVMVRVPPLTPAPAIAPEPTTPAPAAASPSASASASVPVAPSALAPATAPAPVVVPTSAPLPANDMARPPDAEAGPSRLTPPVIAALVAAGTLGAAAAVMGSVALYDHDEYNNAVAAGDLYAADGLAAAGEKINLATDVLLAATLLSAATAGVLLLVGPRGGHGGTKAAVTPLPGGGALLVAGPWQW